MYEKTFFFKSTTIKLNVVKRINHINHKNQKRTKNDVFKKEEEKS